MARIEWIGIRPQSGEEMIEKESVLATPGKGLDGDYKSTAGKREVTLIQAEYLPVIAGLITSGGYPPVGLIHPKQARRNIVISGLNLYSLIDKEFKVGGAIFEGTGPCAPCKKMNETIGPGAHEAMLGLGGITARIVTGGPVYRHGFLTT